MLDQNISDEDLVLKTDDALQVERLEKQNPHLQYRYQVALKKARE